MSCRLALAFIALGLFLHACDEMAHNRSQTADWDRLNYFAVACDPRQHSPKDLPHACHPSPNDDALSAIGRKGGRGR